MMLSRAMQRHLIALGFVLLALVLPMTAPGTPSAAGSQASRWDHALDRARRIPINRADAKQLERLPGVGPALAGRIVADRAARGPFATAQELERVSGIGPKLVERVQEYVTME